MVSTPPNDTDLGKRPATEYVILLGPEDGSKPTLEDQVDYLLLESIKRSRGSNRVDAIVCTYDLSKKGRLIDTTVPTGHNRILEVRTYDREGELTIVKAWGVVTQQSQAITENDEYVTLIARQEPWLFSDPIYDYRRWNTDEFITGDIVFQPIIDDVTENNRAEYGATADPPQLYFVDPESLRSSDAELFQEVTSGPWSLAEAVFYLFQHISVGNFTLPPENDYYEFPTISDLQAIFDDDIELSDVRIPMGSTFPEALDLLIEPFGYFWFVRSEINLLDVSQHYIEFAKRGVGDTVSVHMQRPGETINNLLTSLSEFRASYNISDLANQIKVVSSPIQFEATFELYKGWSQDDDDLELHQLKKGGDGSLYDTKRDVGRRWVLNEARDHDSLRDENDGKGAAELAANLEQDNGLTYANAKRRKFQECFSINPDGESSGIIVEWFNSDLSDDDNPDGRWETVEWPFSVLEKECGIYFEGATPPEELWALINDDPSKARVRITAMVEGDIRDEFLSERLDSSPNGANLTMFLDMSSRFHFRTMFVRSFDKERITTSINKDKDDYDNNESTADSYTKLREFAFAVKEVEDVTLLSCSLTPDGVDHPEFVIGKLVDKVNGRELDLNAKNPDQYERRYPQIVGINEFYNGEQRTELLLESFKEERPRIKGGTR
tara:strand:- start:4835 stop:6835 length:2001 start_codon:yes stop_codon:yes gene_type:complete